MSSKAADLKPSDYVHLHNHTHYSLLDGLQKIKPMLDRVQELGMESIAITDHGTLSGAIDFYKEAGGRGVKPLIGMEAYVASRKHTDKDPSKDKGRFHLILIAMNNTGYQNLMRLSTIANLEGFYHKPRIDHELLEKYHEGLICLSGCIGGEVGEALRYGEDKRAKEIALWYKNLFGDRYYFEIQDHGYQWEEQRKINDKLLTMSKELDIPGVLTCDAHYLTHDDQEAHEILLCVQTGSFLTDQNRMSLTDTDLYVSDPKDLIARWGKDHPDLIRNTKVIADRCDVKIELGKILIPQFPVPEGNTEKTYLDLLVFQGLAWRYGTATEEAARDLSIPDARKIIPENILQRADYELGVIERMGFNGYFLIIWDFIKWGKDQGIVFGPGRGSAAGSIVAYSLRITELDPIKYDLLFERFLNPDRISMPDVDIDIQDTRRDEVIQYCVEKYGSSRVANIVTFGTMAARAAVRDVSRVLQVPYAEADRFAKMVPPPVQGRHIPLAQSVKDDFDLKNEYENNATAKRVFDMAMRLEGTIRSHGVHAAGVVIAPDELVKFAPLEMAQKGVVATQYSMKIVEDLGLLKMDFLGLSNLTVIKNALRIIKRVYGVDIDINTIPLDDQKTFELLQRGDTTGVFQLESSGMKRYLRELKPTVFDDIVAMCALYRPGPLGAGLTDSFIKRKNGLEKVTYDHPTMKAALESTYGVLVYQEQVMQISKDMSGFSGGQADTLRKAIGKKIKEVMLKMEKDFIEGAVKNSGVERSVVEKFWNHLLGFADYCFNKSHSACYGLIAYQTAYLKAHYPAAFMASLMTSDFDDTDRLAIEMSECKHMGIDVLPPDINESFEEFAVVKESNQIRFGMSAIKNVGTGAVEEIVRVRDLEGHFQTLEDYFRKVNVRTVNRKALESLIKAGAFDRFGDRSLLLHNLDSMLAFGQKIQKEVASGQTDLFGNAVETIPTLQPHIKLEPAVQQFTANDMLQWERELLGLYLSSHPLDAFETILSEQAVPIGNLKPAMDGKTVTVGGAISDIREITTKNGQKMAFIKLADKQAELELILFPNTYQETQAIWVRDSVVIAKGKITGKDKNGVMSDEVKILVDEARQVTFEEAASYRPSGKKLRSPALSHAAESAGGAASKTLPAVVRLYLRIEDGQDQKILTSLKGIIDDHSGDTEVVLVLGPTKSKQAIKLPMKVEPGDECLNKLHSLLGADRVRIQ